ncbi:hypothetical protein CSV80_02820 [Sporosarcina sp. P12(2017)]|nr:hypothetical protein [Sporosarcina sp. P12(2017)]PIC58477.1 hypothetical protein CSV81_02815 [Sporosarcina sp. P10]PIC61796.1 hypothetical protein CSV80_02820 [Sporosarcina sp. P12(2017)]
MLCLRRHIYYFTFLLSLHLPEKVKASAITSSALTPELIFTIKVAVTVVFIIVVLKITVTVLFIIVVLKITVTVVPIIVI